MIRIKTTPILFAILMLIPLGAHSQKTKDSNRNSELDNYVLRQNQVTYKTPENFNLIKLKRNKKEYLYCIFKRTYESYEYKVRSKDKNFVAVIRIAPVYSIDSVNIYFELAPDLIMNISTYHLNHIKADFWHNRGEPVTSTIGLPLQYKSPEYARQAFNADTVIIYPLKMLKKYKKKYNHCQVIVLQKNTRGPICLYCFYNDKGEKKLDTYLKSLEGMFWYREPKDFIEVPELPKTDSIIHLKPRKRKRWRKYQDITGDISKPSMEASHLIQKSYTSSVEVRKKYSRLMDT